MIGHDQTWALVPVKSLDQTKQRLAGTLDQQERSTLSLTMLEDVLRTLMSAPEELDGVAVISADAQVLARAVEWGARPLREDQPGDLNHTLAAAGRILTNDGCQRLLLLPADIPLIQRGDIFHLLTAGRSSAASALVASHDGRGTNALLSCPPDAITPQFGTDSFASHLRTARERGLDPTVLEIPSLAHDVDTPDDLVYVLSSMTESRTRTFLERLGGRRRFLSRRSGHIKHRPPQRLDTLSRSHRNLLRRVEQGYRPSSDEAYDLSGYYDLRALMKTAERLCIAGHGIHVGYSRKVFVPLTRLCRDVCHYCTFAKTPRHLDSVYLSPEQVLEIARSGVNAGCKEALFTLGDKPELRYRAARDALFALGYETTLSYLSDVARLVTQETGLLPHLNPGVMSPNQVVALRSTSVSQGLMLESTSDRLCQKGQPHHGSPDKLPATRLATIEAAGAAAVPFTSGILIGIGETRRERIDALLALRKLHQKYGHLQEIIIQNFRAKPGTRMAQVPEPTRDDHLWTVAMARILLGPEVTIQAPPNLSPDDLALLLCAGINDWGGVSPVTPDHVNPEAPWPQLRQLAAVTEAAGRRLVERLAVYPQYVRDLDRWVEPALHKAVLRMSDAQGLARDEDDGVERWRAGGCSAPPREKLKQIHNAPSASGDTRIHGILEKARVGPGLTESEIESLFDARGPDFSAVCTAADQLRAESCGDTVTYVVNRNINYTNLCTYRCGFCAFSKGRSDANLRGRPYDLSAIEIARRTREAWARGATEVCLQGGIHPAYNGRTYLDICRVVKEAVPDIHVHAFSPLEVHHGATTLGVAVREYLERLKDAGLVTLPGTAAEILDDEVRAVICSDKINTAQWLAVMSTAHALGMRTTATIMFGHVDRPRHWARHLSRLRELQHQTGGFTEFVPLPFVHMEAPIYRKGAARQGPTFREAVLMHAVARLALHPLIPNIQVSWVKMGSEGALACLSAGANDLGGTLMNETISRAAGAAHGQEMPPERMELLIRSIGRIPRQRTTLYGDAPAARRSAAFSALPLTEPENTPPVRRYGATAARGPDAA